MSKTLKTNKDAEYSGSPTPFAFFLLICIISLAFTLILFPNLLSVLTGGIAIITLFALPSSVVINKAWEEAIILRFGKFQRLVGPGVFFKWPLVESFIKQDQRIITLDVSKQEVMTKDNISVSVDAVVFVKVVNTKDSLINIQNLWNSVMKFAQTTMRDAVGDVELDELLARRDEIATRIANQVEKETEDWGVDIISVKLQTVELPEDMKRVIARQAEAEREKRAVIIKSEGELTAAENLEKAVKKMSARAMYLRTLSSLEDISFDQSNTIVFAVPMDIVKGEIMGLTAMAQGTKASKETQQKNKDKT